jgi:hypothetical protein
MVKNPKTRRIRELFNQEKERVELIWILRNHGERKGREQYPPQDLINWMKKTDAKNRLERWAQGENTMRFRKETVDWKNHSTNLSRKERVVVSRLRTGYTPHRHVIEKTLSPEWGVAHNRTQTMGVYGNYEREKRNQNHERGMDRWNRRTE